MTIHQSARNTQAAFLSLAALTFPATGVARAQAPEPNEVPSATAPVSPGGVAAPVTRDLLPKIEARLNAIYAEWRQEFFGGNIFSEVWGGQMSPFIGVYPIIPKYDLVTLPPGYDLKALKSLDDGYLVSPGENQPEKLAEAIAKRESITVLKVERDPLSLHRVGNFKLNLVTRTEIDPEGLPLPNPALRPSSAKEANELKKLFFNSFTVRPTEYFLSNFGDFLIEGPKSYWPGGAESCADAHEYQSEPCVDVTELILESGQITNLNVSRDVWVNRPPEKELIDNPDYVAARNQLDEMKRRGEDTFLKLFNYGDEVRGPITIRVPSRAFLALEEKLKNTPPKIEREIPPEPVEKDEALVTFRTFKPGTHPFIQELLEKERKLLNKESVPAEILLLRVVQGFIVEYNDTLRRDLAKKIAGDPVLNELIGQLAGGGDTPAAGAAGVSFQQLIEKLGGDSVDTVTAPLVREALKSALLAKNKGMRERETLARALVNFDVFAQDVAVRGPLPWRDSKVALGFEEVVKGVVREYLAKFSGR